MQGEDTDNLENSQLFFLPIRREGTGSLHKQPIENCHSQMMASQWLINDSKQFNNSLITVSLIHILQRLPCHYTPTCTAVIYTLVVNTSPTYLSTSQLHSSIQAYPAHQPQWLCLLKALRTDQRRGQDACPMHFPSISGDHVLL